MKACRELTSITDYMSTPLTPDPPVHQTKTNADWEEENGCEDAKEAEMGVWDMLALLDALHLGVIRW